MWAFWRTLDFPCNQSKFRIVDVGVKIEMTFLRKCNFGAMSFTCAQNRIEELKSLRIEEKSV